MLPLNNQVVIRAKQSFLEILSYYYHEKNFCLRVETTAIQGIIEERPLQVMRFFQEQPQLRQNRYAARNGPSPHPQTIRWIDRNLGKDKGNVTNMVRLAENHIPDEIWKELGENKTAVFPRYQSKNLGTIQ